ncbi:hypothetical protein quinque_010047 [Culex quinquefasciatus]
MSSYTCELTELTRPPDAKRNEASALTHANDRQTTSCAEKCHLEATSCNASTSISPPTARSCWPAPTSCCSI